jgi:hypothetical protein
MQKYRLFHTNWVLFQKAIIASTHESYTQYARIIETNLLCQNDNTHSRKEAYTQLINLKEVYTQLTHQLDLQKKCKLSSS